MLKSHKVAIARIFTDLIKADRIVDTGEMVCWERLCGKYDIDREVRIAAEDISFSEALNVICTSGLPGIKEDLLGDCRAMTVSDGFCAHSEALLMIALSTMLSSGDTYVGEVISVPRASFNVDIATALYVESEYDSRTNDAITSHYRLLFKELQLGGFHFVYIPKVIDHYRLTDPTQFKDILSFLAPAVSEPGIERIYSRLMEMTTGRFCKDLLCNKCGITALRGTLPSLLIKIGNSFVGGAQYADYLRIDVDEDIVETVQAFVDRFSSMLSSDMFVVCTSEERDSQFHFHGFYKQLLDLFLVRTNIRSRIYIDPIKDEVRFPDIDTHPTGLHRQERALYTLLLCQGADGLNFSRPRTAEGLARYDRRMKKIQDRYADLYAMFGGDRKNAADLSLHETRGPIISRIRSSLRRLRGLYNPDDYTISSTSRGVYSVHVDPDLVYVKESGRPEPVPLRESGLYRRWAGGSD